MIFWGKVALYQLSYFRNMFLVLTENSFSFNPYQGRNVSDLLGQGRALPTEPFSQYVFGSDRKTLFLLILPKVGTSLIFWSKVVLYQLSYLRNMFLSVSLYRHATFQLRCKDSAFFRKCKYMKRKNIVFLSSVRNILL